MWPFGSTQFSFAIFLYTSGETNIRLLTNVFDDVRAISSTMFQQHRINSNVALSTFVNVSTKWADINDIKETTCEA